MATDQIDGWLARRWNQTSAFGSLLDPIADKVLVMAALAMLIAEGVAPAWMVAAILAREFLISGLRLAAIEKGVVIARARPRKAQDMGAGARGRRRRHGGSRGVERRPRVVGAARGRRADVGLGARLRARRAATPRRGRHYARPVAPPAANRAP